MLLVVTMIGPILAPQLQPLLGLTIDATPLVLYFFIFATVYNAILVTTLALQDRKRWQEKEAQTHVFTLMIPSRNEENVIENTINSLMKIQYPTQKLEILAINDGSTDKTGIILEKLALQHPNLRILQVPHRESGQGKSAALNKGFAYLTATSQFRKNPDWIIGVIDADGQVDPNILSKASYSFQDPKTGAVQVLVRISNVKQSILARLQDVEFITFARITQSARTVFRGAVALGGNGQFIRVTTLKSVELTRGEYWRAESLTEDLDLGTRVLLAGWENTFLTTTAIYQHGVTTFRALYKQRTRWSWGALQCFLKYVPTLEIARHKISTAKKLDLLYYLSVPLIPPLIIAVWALSIFALLGLFRVVTPFPTIFLMANSISFFPLIGYGLWTFRKEYPKKYIIPLVVLTTAYTYHWVACTVAAMSRILLRKKPTWVVTRKQAFTYEPKLTIASPESQSEIAEDKQRRKQRNT
jgi:1,2-diacylglycerol 3-beta-glucosyltransferase